MKHHDTIHGRRFASVPGLNPEGVRALQPDHPAVREQRPLFPSSVVDAKDSPRLLVSGQNSIKLGARVTKGPLQGYWLYQLSLPERTTCPSSCHLYRSCYGNSSPFFRRHRPGKDLELRLYREVAELARSKKPGILVRLHNLGDFYSLDYVRVWERILTRYPNVHCFGYTANLTDALDDGEREIAWALVDLKVKFGRQFAIRWSSARKRAGGATVINYVPTTPRVKEGLVCPAETEAAACCAGCGLCFHPSFKDETIVFVLHGMGVNSGKHGNAQYRREKKARDADGVAVPRGRPRKNLTDPLTSGTSHPGRVPIQASARKAQKAAVQVVPQSVGAPLRGVHESSKRRKPAPIHPWANRTGPSITEEERNNRKIRIVWPEPSP